MDQEKSQVDQLPMQPQENGTSPGACDEQQQQHHLLQKLQDSESKYRLANEELQVLRTQQTKEMEQVESYVAHIRGILEERECQTAEYEQENEQMRQELHHIRHQQESQTKELAEMLAQEGLAEMGLSSPSEQVAYLLVERATLRERLEAAERALGGVSPTDGQTEFQQQVQVCHSVLEEQQQEALQKTINVATKTSSQSPLKKLFGLRRSAQSKRNITPALGEEISQERNERQRLERDLDEASRRLAMAHQDIRRLTNELDAAKNNMVESSVTGTELQGTVEEVENLRKEVDKLKHSDMMKLRQAKEENERLDAENKSLWERMQTMCSEKDVFQQQEDISGEPKDRRTNGELQNHISDHESDDVHKRCREAMEDGLVQVRELQRQLQKLRKHHEELEERNEELEALLGEVQNVSKEERFRHEGELEGLQRKIKSLEADLRKQDGREKSLTNGEEAKHPEPYIQLLRDSSQERLALLEARLTEEKDWRKQLEVDLSAAQAALKKDKEALGVGECELKKLRLEVKSLQMECQQGKTLIKSLTQVKGEKSALEEKLAQLERAQSRLQCELEHNKQATQVQERLRGNGLQAEQLQEQKDQLATELSSLQTTHDALRSEMASERRQAAELQARLSASVQERLKAECERGRLALDLQHLQEQLEWHQEELASAKEALSSQRGANGCVESSVLPGETSDYENLEEISRLKMRLNQVQIHMEEERQLGLQHQMTLQAQVNEAQAHVKSQDLVLNQKVEEGKQMKQDLQRAQSLFSSAERELRYEKEKNLDLKRHNTLLDQEKLKLCAELKQVQTKLTQVEQSINTQGSECERQQQKIRDLELELARTSTNCTTATSLQGELQAERTRLIAADRKVLELQQQLKNVQHQLRVEEARTGQSVQLERDSRDLSDTLSALRAKQQEEHITRKLLEQREEELQQQVRSLRLSEATMNRTNAELCHRGQQLETRLTVLETELGKAREEVKDGVMAKHRVQEDLEANRQECDRLQAELQQVLFKLDSHVRKYDEKHSQHKTKLRQAKQAFLKATAQRDQIIQKQENDLLLASSLSHKEKERIQTVTGENEKLLEEKRELLRQVSQAEEIGNQGMRTASNLQHRVNVLEMENRQLQERNLKLSNQASSSERALRMVQSLYGSEQRNSKKMLPSESLVGGALPAPLQSLNSAAYDPLVILDTICRVKVGECLLLDETRSSFIAHQPSEQGYLNLTSPSASSVTAAPQEGTDDPEQV